MSDHRIGWRALALTWAVAITLCYHWYQGFPFSNELGAMAAFLLILAAAAGLGIRLLLWARPPIHSALERWAFALCLGSGALMLAVFGLAVLGFLNRTALLLLLVVLLALGGRALVEGIAAWMHWLAAQGRTAWPAGRALAALVVLPALGWALLHFPAPPTFYDSMAYHLALPAQYLLAGRYVPMPEDLYASLPANMGMLYAVALALAGDSLVNLCTWGIAVLLLLTLYGLSREHFGAGAARLTVTAVAVLPLVQLLIVVPKDDLAFCAFGIAAIWAGFNAVQRQSRRWLVVSGVLLGFALGTRYFAAALGIGLAAALGWSAMRGRGRRALAPAPLALAAAAALLTSSPWLLRNQIEQGNPVYPILTSWIRPHDAGPEWKGGSWRLAESDAYLGSERAWLRSPGKWPRVVLNLSLVLPWDLTVHGRRFEPLLGFLTPILLALLPCLLVLRPWPPATVPLFLGGAVYYLLWAAGFPRLRYLLPAVLLLLPLAGWVSTRLWRERGLAAAFVVAIWAVAISAAAWSSLKVLRQVSDGAAYALALAGSSDPHRLREQYLESRLSYYPLAGEINRRLPRDAVILLVGELRSYYCQRRVRVNGFPQLGTPVRVVEASRTPGEVTAKLRGEGITHLLWCPKEAERLHEAAGYLTFSSREKEELFREFLRAQRIVIRDPAGLVFELNRSPPPALPQEQNQQKGRGAEQ